MTSLPWQTGLQSWQSCTIALAHSVGYKCKFFDTSILFLGHILLAKGISANPEKVEKVRTWPVPRNIKEVQSFLGLASYYRRFIDKFAEKARCLHELVGPTSNKHRKARAKKEATTVIQTELRIFEWTTKHQEAFDALKEALSTAPVLGYPDFSREFILEIDASLNGLGAPSYHNRARTGKSVWLHMRAAHCAPQKDQCATTAQPNWSCLHELLGCVCYLWFPNGNIASIYIWKLTAGGLKWSLNPQR